MAVSDAQRKKLRLVPSPHPRPRSFVQLLCKAPRHQLRSAGTVRAVWGKGLRGLGAHAGALETLLPFSQEGPCLPRIRAPVQTHSLFKLHEGESFIDVAFHLFLGSVGVVSGCEGALSGARRRSTSFRMQARAACAQDTQRTSSTVPNRSHS
jgi:hypothetical protein